MASFLQNKNILEDKSSFDILHHNILDIIRNILQLENVTHVRLGQLEVLLHCQDQNCVKLPTGYGIHIQFKFKCLLPALWKDINLSSFFLIE